MVAVAKAKPEEKKEKQVRLKEIPFGGILRFPSTSFEEAVSSSSSENKDCFYMKIKAQPEKGGRNTIVSLDGQIVLEKDDDHMVVPHNGTFHIEEAELV